MLAFQSQAHSPPDSCTVNILPCRIHHIGPTKITKRYWNPSIEKDGTKTSYFRGRKLRGRTIKLPHGYTGTIAKSTDRILLNQQSTSQSKIENTASDDDNDSVVEIEQVEDVKILENISTFEEMIVWAHDQVPTLDDPFVKGVEEWISFATAIHSNPTENQTQEGG